ncbi:hypothetical protein KC316_g2147 [Hortaea werneckii]|nr:hypothetical protein KC324_g2097 [Hortaea werneckii]KAI7592719.1 hypothetical protein KC316_g2147 [Hortaea werneckii]
MHQKYGPIVRINSKSLHIHDPDYFSAIYAGGGRKVNKEPSAVSGYTFPHSSIATIDHDLHRKRRAIVSPYFSKRMITNLDPVINERLDKLCSRLGETIGPSSIVDLTSAFSAFTADVVTYHFYGSTPDYLSSEGFQFGLKDALTALLDFYHITRFLPFEPTTIKNLPLPLLRLLNPNFGLVVAARHSNMEKVMRVLADPKEKKSKADSVIISALTDASIPSEEKNLNRLLDEGETIIFAGIDTTARTLGVAMFHLLNKKVHVRKLREEINARAKPADHVWTVAELESLPYMRGVVQEALRLTYGLVVRIPRVSAEEALRYQDFIIPPGTPVSQSTYFINNDPSIFPNPSVFDPERWIRAANEGVNLDKYMLGIRDVVPGHQ